MGEAPVAIREGEKLHLDLLIIIFLAMLAVICALLLPNGNALRVVVTVPLMILYPGYAMVSALWPENNSEGKSIDILARIALSIGLSIAAISVIGIVLSFTTGLTMINIVFTVFALIVIFTAIALFRRKMLPEERRFSLDRSIPTGNAETAVFVLVVACIVFISGFAAYAIFVPGASQPYSELYLLDSNRTTQNYPVNISVNETANVILGVVNHENAEVAYRIHAICGNSTSPTYLNDWDGQYTVDNLTNLARNITLADGSTFEETFSFRFTEPGLYKLSWSLFVENQATDYELHLWIRVHPQ